MTRDNHDTVVEPAIEVDLAFRTDPGRDPEKQVNEDSGFHMATRFGTLCVVCDGMGGHANGQDASRAAVSAIRETFDGVGEGSVGRELLVAGITLGHDRIRGLPLASGEGRSGSTVVAVLITPHGAEIAHVGDSRVYHVTRGTVQQVTRDHSMVQLMVEAGMIKPEEAATHPDANKIMRALGIAATVEVDVRSAPLPFAAGDFFVLASDGLTDLVSEAEILSHTALPGEQAVGQLVDLANARGGHDNITVLIARPREGSHGGAPPGPTKTVPVTAVDPPAEMGRVSPATVLAAPLPLPIAPGASSQTAMGPPLQLAAPAPMIQAAPIAPASGPHLPSAPPESGLRRGGSRVLPTLVALVALVVLVGAAVALYKLLEKPAHHRPAIVASPSVSPNGDGADADAPEAPTPDELPAETPPLPPAITAKPPHHHGHKTQPSSTATTPAPAPPK